MKTCLRTRQSRGFTLLEVMVVMSLTSGAGYVVTQTLLSSQNVFQTGVHDTYLQARALEIINEITDEVKDASATNATFYGNTNGVIWFYKCLGYWPAGQNPPGEPALVPPVSGTRWSSVQIQYIFEPNVNGRNLLSRYENGVRVRVLSNELSPNGFSMVNNGTSRVRLFVRLQETFFDPLSGTQTVTATAGTDVRRQN